MCGMFVTGLPLPGMTIILILTVFSQDSFVVGEYRRYSRPAGISSRSGKSPQALPVANPRIGLALHHV